MVLTITADSLDELPEALREHAKEEGGKFTLAALPQGYGVDNVAKLKGQLAEAQKKHTNAAAKILTKEDGSAYTKDDLDAILSQVADLTKANETLSAKDKSTNEKVAELVAQAKKPLEQEAAKTRQALDRYRVRALTAESDRVVDKIVEKLNPLPQWKGLLRSEIRRHVKASEAEDGTISTVIINPDDGTEKFSALSGNNGPMGWEEFAGSKDLRDQFGECLAGDGKEGAGARNERGGPRHGVQRGKDVVLPREHTQEEFEAAFKTATERGGDVQIAEA